jgi:putative phosphoesterase
VPLAANWIDPKRKNSSVSNRITRHNIPKCGRRIVGVLSDTHGLLRPEVLPLFKGADLILHAGDIGRAGILEELRTIAPVLAVRGNNDSGDWASRICEFETTTIGSVRIYILHDVKTMPENAVAAGVEVVVSGHSHRPSVVRRGPILFLNPGSAGPRRFKLPISIARLFIEGTTADAELIEIGSG